ncbi:DUF6369 family protein [Motiliproteus sp. MSK22-1]|uniref:DUF6369 family protein n=1 Tax=Motiliproteus sp. MSK22-1 TaxID=1897630 RepID=UPI0009779D90|nr:DUF6369 family protein [Motiliproteus sp. MSK22-1]OMH25771.1 hypothetical protein BGP75_24930 [Motiliproteus sp. MSK22-1]
MFFILSAIFFALGLFYKRTVVIFLFLIVAFVFGNGFSNLYYKYGLYAYDFYFLSFIVMFFYNSIVGREKIYNTNLAIPIVMIIVYVLFSAVYTELDKYFVRDFRLLLFLLECFVVYQVCRMSSGINSKVVMSLVIVASFSNIIYWWLSSFGLIGYSDVYYNDNKFRYFDLSTYICSVYIVFSPLFLFKFYLNKIDIISFSLAVLCVLVSGSRMVVLVSIFFFMFVYVSNIKKLVLGGVFLVGSFFIIYLKGLDGDLLTRVSDLSFDVIKHHLEIRYSPFFDLVQDFELYNFVFGRGFGTTFFIPWFEYRSDNLVPVNNFIDTTYFTLFAKFGVLSLVFIYFYIRLAITVLSSVTALKPKVCLVLYLLCLMFVYAIPYQSSAIGIFIGLLLVFFRLSEVRTIKSSIRVNMTQKAVL